MSTILQRRWFSLGMMIRVALLLAVVPVVRQIWFAPFLQHVVEHPSLDPWGSFLEAGGDPLAFPYGPVMVLGYLPGALLGNLLEPVFGLRAVVVGIGVTAIGFELLLLRTFRRFPLPNPSLAQVRYWVSPIALYVTFFHGQLDVLPVALVLVGIGLVLADDGRRGGVFLALAVGAKLSMVVAVPFVIVYALRNRKLHPVLREFSIAFTVVSGVLFVPALYSSGFRSLVFSSPEFLKLSSARIDFGAELGILILPTAFMLLLYYAWSIGPMSKGMLMSLVGSGFFLVLIFTPPSAGWFLWVVPFVAMYESRWRQAWLLAALYAVAAVSYGLLHAAGAAISWLGVGGTQPIAAGREIFSTSAESLALSIATAVGSVLCYRMLRHGRYRSSVFATRHRPLALGIAGDSATGKDTLADALAGVFGEESTAVISGDNYHAWDRHGPMWQSVTHLNPVANELDSFTAHVLQMIQGTSSIQARHYDHSSGRFSSLAEVPNNDVVIVSGLHALYPRQLRRELDVKVFLDHDEDLRRTFKLRRDTVERGHSPAAVLASLDRRAADAARYIRPQVVHADVVFSLRPSTPLDLDAESVPVLSDVHLVVRLNESVYYTKLVRLLISLCGAEVELRFPDDPAEAGAVELEIAADPTDDDIACLATALIPRLDEITSLNPRWQAGTLGLMQLIVVAHAAQALATWSRSAFAE